MELVQVQLLLFPVILGAEKKDDANNAAIHSAILSVAISLALTVFFLLVLESLLKIMGASEVMGYAMDYGIIIFAFTAPILIPPIFGGAFRAEGDVKRATLPIAMVAVVNTLVGEFPVQLLQQDWLLSLVFS